MLAPQLLWRSLADGNVSDALTAPTVAVFGSANPTNMPGLNTQGLSHVRLDFAIGGVVPLHMHPRASETLFVLSGTIYTGFISDDNTLFAATLQAGELIVFPRASVHFLLNAGNTTASTLNALNSQDPGFLLAANQILVPNMPASVIEKSFGINAATVNLLKKSYPGHP